MNIHTHTSIMYCSFSKLAGAHRGHSCGTPLEVTIRVSILAIGIHNVYYYNIWTLFGRECEYSETMSIP